MIERAHLTILRELDRANTITEAAKRLHLTQSALSHSIKKLEQQHNITLWEKHGRTLRLTQEGQYLLSVANRLLPQLEYAEQRLHEFAQGQRGNLRIGMECHPCYQWLLSVVDPFLKAWPNIDLDVKQRFQFGGLAALFNYDIDLLITPDPLYKKGLHYTPVFAYELVLVVADDNPLANKKYITPSQLQQQTLITYPVEKARLDIYNQFLIPANVEPLHLKCIETTDIMLQMISANRGVTALPAWLVGKYKTSLKITPVRLGKLGIHKKIHIAYRQSDSDVEYLNNFISMAQYTG